MDEKTDEYMSIKLAQLIKSHDALLDALKACLRDGLTIEAFSKAVAAVGLAEEIKWTTKS